MAIKLTFAHGVSSNHSVDTKFQYRENMSTKPCGVGKDDNGQDWFQFSPNAGKGTGAQTVLMGQMRELIEFLNEVSVDGIPAGGMLSAADVARATIAEEDGIYTFRTSSGKGSKPVHVRKAELAEFVEILGAKFHDSERAWNALSKK
jgi:hypothetical protein